LTLAASQSSIFFRNSNGFDEFTFAVSLKFISFRRSKI
jgi:hypothetical protein